MDALKLSFKTSLKWLGIFTICTLVAAGMAFTNQGGAAAAQKLVGLGGASVLITVAIFIYSFFFNLFSKNKSTQDKV